MEIIIVVLCVAIAAYLYKQTKKDKKPPASSSPYPCVIEGTLDASPMEDRIKALAIEAQSKGITITGDYAADVKAQGGEMTLLGYSFKFVFDAAGQVIDTQSHCNLFGHNYQVNGGMNPQGELGMGIVVESIQVDVSGKVVNGKFIDGIARKPWLPHIYGVLNGTYTKL